jgi:hypothetical protein
MDYEDSLGRKVCALLQPKNKQSDNYKAADGTSINDDKKRLEKEIKERSALLKKKANND